MCFCLSICLSVVNLYFSLSFPVSERNELLQIELLQLLLIQLLLSCAILWHTKGEIAWSICKWLKKNHMILISEKFTEVANL